MGLLLDAVATLAGATGKQLLRHAAVSENSWYYLLGLCFTAVVDPAFDLMAYSFAAQSIIAAAAGLVIVWNVGVYCDDDSYDDDCPFSVIMSMMRSRVSAALFELCIVLRTWPSSVRDFLFLFIYFF